MTDKITITWADDQGIMLAQWSQTFARDLINRAFSEAVNRVIEVMDEEANRGRTDCP